MAFGHSFALAATLAEADDHEDNSSSTYSKPVGNNYDHSMIMAHELVDNSILWPTAMAMAATRTQAARAAKPKSFLQGQVTA